MSAPFKYAKMGGRTQESKSVIVDGFTKLEVIADVDLSAGIDEPYIMVSADIGRLDFLRWNLSIEQAFQLNSLIAEALDNARNMTCASMDCNTVPLESNDLCPIHNQAVYNNG